MSTEEILGVRKISVDEALRIGLQVPEEGTDAIMTDNEQLCLRAGDTVYVFPEGKDSTELSRVIRTAHLEQNPSSKTIRFSWRELLTSSDVISRESAIQALKLPENGHWCVVLFQPAQDQNRSVGIQRFRDLAPLEREDVLTDLDSGKIALIKTIGDHSSEDVAEFTAAIIETVENETGVQLNAGIGNGIETPGRLCISLEQAKQAIQIGRHFKRSSTVWEFRRLLLERLLLTVPEEKRMSIQREWMTPEVQRMMNEEMRETVKVFFQNDLSLSSTARQLFIHRNTLNYRLEKIRKETGFDLHRFHDAASFMILDYLPAEE